MAMAGSPPAWTTNQTYYVTRHAIERIRTRSQPASHLDDAPLCRLIDDAVVRGLKIEGNSFEVKDDNNEKAILVLLDGDCLDELLIQGDVYALLKENHKSDSNYSKAVVTVLTTVMVDKFYRDQIDGKKQFSNTMADQLSRIELKQEKHVEKPQPKKDYIIVVDDQIKSRYTRQELEKALEIFANGPGAFEVYRRVPTKIKVELEE